jgi:ketosteroid isomerase-like protein
MSLLVTSNSTKAVVNAYYDAAIARDRSMFYPFIHEDFVAVAPSYVPLGGKRHDANSFREVVMPHLDRMLDFSRFNYESLTAEGGHVVALVKIGIADTPHMVMISEHWEVVDNKALSLLVAFFEPQRVLESMGLTHGLQG